MSGIFGIWNLDGKAVEKEHLNAMKDRIIQYGRDAQDICIDKNIGFGSCLNKISNYNEKKMPIYIDNNQKEIVISDSQIYNRDELIEEYNLTDDKLISNNELILKAYKKWRQDCAKYINGDFTFVIWEKEKNELLIVRDHLGVRPLYYYYHKSIFIFATDYRAILTLPFVSKEINEMMLYIILSNNNKLEAEETYFKNIKRLPQSNLFKINKDGISKYKYWTPGLKKIIYKTDEEYFRALYNVVEKAIKIRINNTNLKLGAQLSGGLDSSVITILANRELIKRKEKLELFSWSPSFEEIEKQSRDERAFIELICKQEDLKCKYYDFNKDLEKFNLNKETLTGYGLGILNQELERMTSENVRLILTGWGGDQGISHRTNLFGLFVNGYWKHFFKEAYGLSKGSILRFGKIIISNTVLKLFGTFSYFSISHKNKINIADKEFNKKMKKYIKKNILYFNIDPVRHLESGNIQTRTETSAEIGADYNVQYLFPFLDYNVVDFAMSIPSYMYYKNGINRYSYRKAFESILPKELCYYMYKDDNARQTYNSNKIQDYHMEKDILENKLNKKLFSKYLDFNEAINILNEYSNGDKSKRFIKRQILACYNIQKLLENVTDIKGDIQ